MTRKEQDLVQERSTRPCFIEDCGDRALPGKLCCERHRSLENLLRFQITMAMLEPNETYRP